MKLETSDDYTAYVRSFTWKQFKQKRLILDNYTCQICKVHHLKDKGWVLHHITYERLGEELIGDFRMVCISCHDKINHLSIPHFQKYANLEKRAKEKVEDDFDLAIKVKALELPEIVVDF